MSSGTHADSDDSARLTEARLILLVQEIKDIRAELEEVKLALKEHGIKVIPKNNLWNNQVSR